MEVYKKRKFIRKFNYERKSINELDIRILNKEVTSKAIFSKKATIFGFGQRSTIYASINFEQEVTLHWVEQL